MLSKFLILHIFLTIKYTKLILLSRFITTVAGNGTSGDSGAEIKMFKKANLSFKWCACWRLYNDK